MTATRALLLSLLLHAAVSLVMRSQAAHVAGAAPLLHANAELQISTGTKASPVLTCFALFNAEECNGSPIVKVKVRVRGQLAWHRSR